MNRSRAFRLMSLPLLLVAGLLLCAPGARADDDDDHEEARALLQRGEILPLAQVLALVQARVPGDVIEVELEREDGAWEYQVKVLTASGRVRKLTLDARTGTVLKIKDD